jgi:hypothetical protein
MDMTDPAYTRYLEGGFESSGSASPATGHGPTAVFGARWASPAGGSEPAETLAIFEERLIEALHVAERLVRSPEALANLLEAAGPLTLEGAGALLNERARVPG